MVVGGLLFGLFDGLCACFVALLWFVFGRLTWVCVVLLLPLCCGLG